MKSRPRCPEPLEPRHLLAGVTECIQEPLAGLRQLLAQREGHAGYLLQHALGRFEGNQTKAARYLQISEASLRYKLKKYEIANKA